MRKRVVSAIMWVLVVVVVAGLSVYLFSELEKEDQKEMVEKKTPDTKILFTEEEQEEIPVKEETPLITPPEVDTTLEPLPKEDPCRQIEDDLAEYFRYLDSRDYLVALFSKPDTSVRFRKILKQLEDSPPVPAGEGNQTEHMMRNITHFFHIMEKEDILFVKAILTRERETLESDLKLFFKWFSLGDHCPDADPLRPSRLVLYRYAGFFLNTIGGRSYLFRRTPSIRLLVSYYCLLVLHDADKTGENSYGLDIFPYIEPMRNEIADYPNFQFQAQYIERLRAIEIYYLQKRMPMS